MKSLQRRIRHCPFFLFNAKYFFQWMMYRIHPTCFKKSHLRWIFLAVLLQWHLTGSQTLFNSTHSMQNAHLKGFTFQVLTGITSYFECYMKCQEAEYCFSVNHYPAKSVCELNSATHLSHSDNMVYGVPHATYLMDSLKPLPGKIINFQLQLSIFIFTGKKEKMHLQSSLKQPAMMFFGLYPFQMTHSIFYFLVTLILTFTFTLHNTSWHTCHATSVVSSGSIL